MNKAINNFIIDFKLPPEFENFTSPFTNIIKYNAGNYDQLCNSKKIFISGPGFDSKGDAEKFPELLDLIENISNEIIKYPDLSIVTGCCSDYSISTKIAEKIKEKKPSFPIFGVSRYGSLPLKDKYRLLDKIHDAILYCGYENMDLPESWKFALQDLAQIMISDGLLAMQGSTGTNHEISIAYELRKLVGLIIGFGGVTDSHPSIIETICQDGRKGINAKYDKNPCRIIDWLVKQL